MRKVIALLLVTLMLSVPAFANVDQKASISGENAVVVKVNQEAWNYGSGNINQNLGVHVTGNTQLMDQESVIIDAGDINSTIKGMNLIKIDLDQYGNNTGSGNIVQGINVLVDNNIQILDQKEMVVASGYGMSGYGMENSLNNGIEDLTTNTQI